MPPDSPSISLQQRYRLAALLLVLLIVILTIWGQFNLHSIRHKASTSLDSRYVLLQATHEIRTELLNAYRSMDSFLLEPDKQENLNQIRASIVRAIQTAHRLEQHPWIVDKNKGRALNQLRSSLKQLNEHLEEVIAVRQDISRQYPALAVARIKMGPSSRTIDNSFLVSFNEMKSDDAINQQQAVYVLFAELQKNWIRMLANFRLYLANRIGTFNEQGLAVQEQSIEMTYQHSLEVIAQLEEADANGQLGFESSSALRILKQNLTGWFQGFTEVKAIHATGKWRIDSVLVKSRIIPSIDGITLDLRKLEDFIQQNVDADVSSYADLTQKHMYLILVVAVAATLLVMTFIWLSNRYLFNPLAILANALRAESSNKSPLEIPASRIRETQELVDAFVDMRHQVRLRQNELEYRALHDGLTSLPNRALLMDHIQHDLEMASRDSRTLGLIIIDLDRFKEINDTLGHAIGDQVLVEVGGRFQSSLRGTDTVARLGGDEFAVLMPNTSLDGTQKIARNILESLEKPVVVNDIELHVNASIGIAMYPEHGKDAQTLLQHADVAMYDAKQHQKGFTLYNPDNDQYSIKRLSLINDIRTAINNSEFTLHYQPIVSCLNDNQKLYAEALLRWDTTRHGDISPEIIISLAEQTGLISSLTEWVIDSALAQTRKWLDLGLDFNISINLSMYNLRENDLAERIQSCLTTYDLPPDILTLEITESAMMFNPGQVIRVLNQLNEMGVRLAIDDFGTGFSSLAYLKQLPVHQIKIDKSFVLDLENSTDAQMIVKSTIHLAENLGLTSIVEGVETSSSLSLLRQFGCKHAQGYLFSRPLTASDYHKYITKDQARTFS